MTCWAGWMSLGALAGLAGAGWLELGGRAPELGWLGAWVELVG